MGVVDNLGRIKGKKKHVTKYLVNEEETTRIYEPTQVKKFSPDQRNRQTVCAKDTRAKRTCKGYVSDAALPNYKLLNT